MRPGLVFASEVPNPRAALLGHEGAHDPYPPRLGYLRQITATSVALNNHSQQVTQKIKKRSQKGVKT